MAKKLRITILIIVSLIIYQAACKLDKVEIPEPTGISGAKVFLTIAANPDILISNGISRTTVSVRLADYQNKPIGNVTVFFETLNADQQKWDIGRFTSNRVVTGGDGMAYTYWIAPNTSIDTIILIRVTTIDGEWSYQINATTMVYLVKPDNYPDSPPAGKCGQGGYPSPVMNFQPSQPIPGDVVTFSAAGSYDTDGYIASYLWNFGDGTKGKGETVRHTYKMEGTYLVILTVTDNDGKNCSISSSISVGSAFGCAISTQSGGPGGTSTITITTQNGAPNYKWYIDLGDGTIYQFTTAADSMSIDHIYATPGPFNVYVRVRDGTNKSTYCTSVVL